MSVKVMSAVWDAEGLSATDKLILLSLADHANDEGVCYPSVSRLTKRTGLSERAVQGAIKRLASAGWLAIEANAGPRGCNVFTIRPTPAAGAPPQQMHPRRKCTKPPQQVRPTPAAGAPEPSENHQKPSYSEANASDAGGVADDDFAKQLFDRGVAFLGNHGVPERQARSVVGRWRKDHPDPEIFGAFVACSKAGAVDPIPWIAARLGGAKIDIREMMRSIGNA